MAARKRYRLGVAAQMMMLGAMASAAATPQWTLLTRADARAFLRDVKTWGCQYQNIDIDALAASALDLIVIDPVIDGATGRRADASDLQKLQRKPDGSRRMALAYLAIGAAEEYRGYWQPDWGAAPPEWLGPADPVWPRSHAVKFWHPDWQQIVSAGLEQIIAAGFDGVFLDRVDAFQDWTQNPNASQADMITFVARLAEISRKIAPQFVLVSQNAEPLLDHATFRQSIDAVSKESLLSGLQGEGIPNSSEQIAWSMAFLSRAQRDGLVILSIEYAKNSDQRSSLARRLRDMHFKPFFAKKLLDHTPD
jgi:cysteinyl-tRNA synthetase, unknown class